MVPNRARAAGEVRSGTVVHSYYLLHTTPLPGRPLAEGCPQAGAYNTLFTHTTQQQQQFQITTKKLLPTDLLVLASMKSAANRDI